MSSGPGEGSPRLNLPTHLHVQLLSSPLHKGTKVAGNYTEIVVNMNILFSLSHLVKTYNIAFHKSFSLKRFVWGHACPNVFSL